MSSHTLVRWSGLAAIVGGALFVVTDLASFFVLGVTSDLVAAAVHPAWNPLITVALASQVLVMLALVGIYARQSAQAGTFGLIAFLLAFVGTALLTGFMWTNLFVVPELARVSPALLAEDSTGGVLIGILVSLMTAALGWLLFGVSTLLAKVLPRWAAVVLIAGGVFSALPLPFGAGLVLGAGLVWSGYALWREKGLAA